MRKVLCFLAVLALSASAAQADLIRHYEFNQDGVLPSAEPDVQFRNGAAPGNEAYFSVSGGLLIGNTMPEVNNYVGYTYPSQPPIGGGIDSSAPWFIETRLRILETAGGTTRFGEMHVYNGSHQFVCFHTSNSVRFVKANGTYHEVTMDISQWHVVRMEGDGGGRYRAYVDGVLIAADIPSGTSAYNGFLWQNNTAYKGAHIEWDYVRLESGALAIPTENASFSSIKASYR